MKCEICGKEFKNLSSHLKKKHNMSDEEIKEYYDKYLKFNIEGKCLICGKETEFNGINFGYNKYCSNNCRHKSLSIQNNNSCNESSNKTKLLENIEKIDNHHNSLKPKNKTEKKVKCEICGKYFNKISYHVKQEHSISAKEYYDKYLKKDDEGICAVCGKPTQFYSIEKGYRKHCSPECNCKNEERIKKAEETLLKNYGITTTFKSEEIREKIKSTNIKKYGYDNILKSPKFRNKIQETNFRKYGYEIPSQSNIIKEKTKVTNLKKYGVEYPSQLEEIKEKTKQTNIKKYGGTAPVFDLNVQNKIRETNLEKYNCEYPMQNKEVKKKWQVH